MKYKHYLTVLILFSFVAIIPFSSTLTSTQIVTLTNSPFYKNINDMSWTIGCFSTHNKTLTLIGMEGFNYSISEEEIHLEEDGGVYPNPYDSPSYTSVGAYATFPTIDGKLYLTFEGRAKAEHPDAVLMGIRIYDPTNMTWLMSSSSNPAGIDRIIGYSLDSGYVKMKVDITISGYDELVVYWSYDDYFSTDWHQEIWLRNLEINPSTPTFRGLEWTFGCFSCHNNTLTYISNQGFNYNISEEEIHLEEIGGIYPDPYGSPSYTSVGAYATFPTIDGKLYLTFEGRAKAEHIDAVLLGIRIYDPSNMTWLMSSASDPIGIDHIQSPALDSGYVEMKVNITIPGYEKLIVYWSYDDYFIADWHQEIWLRNLVFYELEETTPAELETTTINFSWISLGIIGVISLSYLMRKK